MVEAVAGGLVLNIVAVAVVILFVFTLMLPKKLHYIVNGLILIGLGGTHILYEFYFTEIDIRGSPIVRFIIAFVVMVTAKELIKESLKEKGAGMKAATLIVGLVLIMLALIPEMYHYGAISFDLPELPMLFSFVYIIGGIVAILTPFFIKE